MNMPEVNVYSNTYCLPDEVKQLESFTKDLMQDCKELMTELNDCLPILDMWQYEADAESVRELLTRIKEKYNV